MQLYLLYLQIIPTFVPIKSNPIINKTSTAVMKKKTILFASCLLGVLAFSSCEKNLYDESKQPEKEIQVKDLNIPAGFQWKLTQVAAGTVAATTPTMVSFFLDEACSKEENSRHSCRYRNFKSPFEHPNLRKYIVCPVQNQHQ